MNVRLETLFNGHILLVALAVTAVAFAGKIATSLVAGPVKKSLVGWGMVPRGEVGLIFASIGKSLDVISDALFSVIVIMVIARTLLTPPILASLLRRSDAKRRSERLLSGSAGLMNYSCFVRLRMHLVHKHTLPTFWMLAC